MIEGIVAAMVALAFATSSPWWWHDMPWAHSTEHVDAGLHVVGFSGGCGTFRVVAQNRWNPVGTKKENAPDPLATQVGGFAPNETVPVDGWVHGNIAYPNNRPPWNSDVWYHVTSGGWVAFAAVRAVPTDLDPTGHADGGPPAATSPTCEGSTH
jgi:hypothetical protein